MNSNDTTMQHTRSTGPFSHSWQRRPTSSSAVATTAPPPADSGIAAFADTIQERIRTLSSENDLLQEAEERLTELAAAQDEHAQDVSKIRRTYLQAGRERLGVELEYLSVQEQQLKCQKSTAVLLAETAAMLLQTADQREQWEATMQSIFSQHECNLELYTRNVQGQIQVCDDSVARRARRVKMLREGAENFVVEQDWLLEQQKLVEYEMERCNEHEAAENDAVQDLALQVRVSTDKVCVCCVQTRYHGLLDYSALLFRLLFHACIHACLSCVLTVFVFAHFFSFVSSRLV
jgi:hypothetical protein